MIYTALSLTNFRSYERLDVDLEGGVTIVVGPNAAGKTNLLEALLVLSRGNSYRVTDRDLIKHDEESAKLTGYYANGERSLKLTQGAGRTTKEFKIDGVVRRRLTLEHTLPVTLFEPEHLRLINGSPERRRLYLDELLAQSKPAYQSTIRRYQKALQQRNRLLREGRASDDQLFVWDVQLATHGQQIVSGRSELVAMINERASELYSQLAGQTSELQLHYQHQRESMNSDNFLRSLQAHHRIDHERGHTTIGPHRDDIIFHLNGQPAGSSASRGESRTMVLTCKLIELELLRETRGQQPLFLLDDVFSELDGKRRQALTERIKDTQAFITTTDADTVTSSLHGSYQSIALEALT